MSQRPDYEFLKGAIKRGDPTSVKDIRIGRGIPSGWHYLGDSKITNRNNESYGSWQETDKSKKVRQFVEAIEKGDLDYIKKMDPKELKKYLNEAVIQMDRLPMPPGIMWMREPSPEDIEKEWARRGAVPGYTPLMLAAMEGQTDIMRYLIEQGALATIKNAKGNTAADYLKRYKEQQKKKKVVPRKTKDDAAEQKAKDELNELMDDVEEKKKPKKKPLPPKIIVPPGFIKGEVTTMYGVKWTKLKDGKTKGQYGNGKGLDDKIGALQEENKKILTKAKEKHSKNK